MYGKSRLQSSQLMARARVVGNDKAAGNRKDPLKRARAAMRKALVTKNGGKLR